MSAPLVTPLAALPPRAWLARRRTLPFPFGLDGVQVYARARHALWHGVRALGLGAGDEILVPAFHHGSEVEAFRRAGLRCRFYGHDPLRPDEGELDELVGPSTRALHLIHYLGVPQDAARWRRWCDERGLLLVEDAAQSWLAHVGDRPVGSFGDLAVFCLYKTFGLADGAVLLCREPPGVPARGRRGAAGVLLEHAMWLAGRSRALARLADGRPPRPYVPAEEMALGDQHRGVSRATLAVLPRVADAGAAGVRRRNYARLAGLVRDVVAPGFESIPAGASPFVLPIAVERKAETVAALRARRVRALELWAQAHESLPRGAFPRADELRRTLVGLPVHQELREGDLERVAAAVRATCAAPARALPGTTRTSRAASPAASAARGS